MNKEINQPVLNPISEEFPKLKEIWRADFSSGLTYQRVNEWNQFPEKLPISGTYEVVINNKYGVHVDVAEYSESRKAFLWYSRRGYPYELKEVTHWKVLSPLPLPLTLTEENQDDTVS